MRTHRILVVDAAIGAAETLALLPDIDGFDVHCAGNRRRQPTVYVETPAEALFPWPEEDGFPPQSYDSPER